ncbi:MFS transporter [Actinomyces sp.]|uniref:MFS transporter n=1 Tax=Actinomyces sp. TaxID=29317 RepID=UPI0026DBFB6A|nr:MFS transporter [Actinomyces sp.]MDO4899866.1 MFS transporter [Actinomyces sp.]
MDGERRKRDVWRAICIGCVCGMLFGYGTGAVAPGLPYISQYLGLDAAGSGVVVSCLLVAAALASPAAGVIADRFGRDTALCVSAVIYGIGACIWAMSSAFWMLVIGRVLVGVGVGSVSFLGPMTVAERVPSEMRGRAVGADQLMVTVGILCSAIAGHLLGNGREWRLVALLPVAGVLALIVLVMFQPNRVGGRSNVSAISKPEGARRLLWGVRSVRRSFFVAVVLAAGVHLTGLNVAVYYAPTVIAGVGARPAVATAGSALVAVVNVFCTMLALMLIDRVGRRPLMIGGLMIMAVSASGFGIVSEYAGSVGGTIALLAVFLAAGAIGPAAVFWVYVSEIFPFEVRATAVAWATFVQWMTDFLVSLIFPTMVARYSFAGAMRIFALVTLGTICVSWLWMAETRGRDMPELDA